MERQGGAFEQVGGPYQGLFFDGIWKRKSYFKILIDMEIEFML